MLFSLDSCIFTLIILVNIEIMKYKIILLLLVVGLSFAVTSCRDKSDIADLIELLRKKNRGGGDDKFDCPRLELNFKDKCRTADGTYGFVNADCECETRETDKRFDCPELEKNFKDRCETRDGKVGYVNESCECQTEEADGRFDCPELEKNFKDPCITAAGTRGYVNADCECESK